MTLRRPTSTLTLLAALLLAAVTLGCVHQFVSGGIPDPPAPDCRLTVEITLPLEQWIVADSSVVPLGEHRSAPQIASLNRRLTIRAFRRTDRSRPAAERSVIIPANERGEFPLPEAVELTLPAGEMYQIVGWLDMVGRSAPSQSFHDIADFAEILRADGIAAGGEWRLEAFSGSVDVDLAHLHGRSDETVSLPLRRPFGCYVIVATDFEAYRAADPRAAEALFGHPVRLRYPGFVPVSYSPLSDRLTDSQPGIEFDFTPRMAADSSGVILGYDILPVGSAASLGVTVALGFGATDDRFFTASMALKLGRDTALVVRGPFLTAPRGEGGIGVNPGFDGEYNIRIP